MYNRFKAEIERESNRLYVFSVFNKSVASHMKLRLIFQTAERTFININSLFLLARFRMEDLWPVASTSIISSCLVDQKFLAERE